MIARIREALLAPGAAARESWWRRGGGVGRGGDGPHACLSMRPWSRKARGLVTCTSPCTVGKKGGGEGREGKGQTGLVEGLTECLVCPLLGGAH